MTYKDILATALRQSALELNCDPGDFLSGTHKVALSAPREGARAYLELPFDFQMVSYGDNVVASVSPAFESLARAYLEGKSASECFETPRLNSLGDALRPHGLRVCFMAEYFLPDPGLIRPLPCPFELRVLGLDDFSPLYASPFWRNALCEKRRALDVLGVGAFDKETLVGLAACSADCADMWQIGVDVLPAYRRMGIASAATSRLALEIMKRGKAPFYCAAWSNIRSVRSAIRAGFRPAWVETTAKSEAFIADMLVERPGTV